MTAPFARLAFLDSLGGPELLVILVVVLIFFGGQVKTIVSAASGTP